MERNRHQSFANILFLWTIILGSVYELMPYYPWYNCVLQRGQSFPILGSVQIPLLQMCHISFCSLQQMAKVGWILTLRIMKVFSKCHYYPCSCDIFPSLPKWHIIRPVLKFLQSWHLRVWIKARPNSFNTFFNPLILNWWYNVMAAKLI